MFGSREHQHTIKEAVDLDLKERYDFSGLNFGDIVADFMYKFFTDVNDVVEFNLDFLETRGFRPPQIDYFKLRRFINTAINDIKYLDPSLIDGTLNKLYKDVNHLNEYYHNFDRRTKVSSAVFMRDFFGNFKFYEDLQSEIKSTLAMGQGFKNIINTTEAKIKQMGVPRNKDDSLRIKNLKRRNIDAIHNLSKVKDRLQFLRGKAFDLEKLFEDEFYRQFGEYKEYYMENLKLIINTKTFYLDKLLWFKAKDSENVIKFFKNSHIQGNYDTKTFIRYYLKNINLDHAKDGSWHSYLAEVVDLLD